MGILELETGKMNGEYRFVMPYSWAVAIRATRTNDPYCDLWDRLESDAAVYMLYP